MSEGTLPRYTGTVKWFSRVKGYGFISPDDEDKDIFVHYSAILADGYRNLEEGQRVEYAVETTDKGPQAVQVQGLDGLQKAS
jgi:CspA family cold shock protein